MTRPTNIHTDKAALLHNLRKVKELAPKQKVIAMVKSNGYGCGLAKVVSTLDGHVDSFGVASLDEALQLKEYSSKSNCVIFQGIFGEDELEVILNNNFHCVIHQTRQLQWLINNPLPKPIKIWVKVNTGMNRLGFHPQEMDEVFSCLSNTPWIDRNLGLMTHLACADEPQHMHNQDQFNTFNQLNLPYSDFNITRSVANSAAILKLPAMHVDVIRPGIMLYGISPFTNLCGQELGLNPVMQFTSAISSIQYCKTGSKIGYGSTWECQRDSVIAVVAVGYGDGYPRHVSENTPTKVGDYFAPIVGRISMDTLTIDITDCKGVKEGDCVELWGNNIPVERIAHASETIPYELICQVSPRVHRD